MLGEFPPTKNDLWAVSGVKLGQVDDVVAKREKKGPRFSLCHNVWLCWPPARGRSASCLCSCPCLIIRSRQWCLQRDRNTRSFRRCLSTCPIRPFSSSQPPVANSIGCIRVFRRAYPWPGPGATCAHSALRDLDYITELPAARCRTSPSWVVPPTFRQPSRKRLAPPHPPKPFPIASVRSSAADAALESPSASVFDPLYSELMYHIPPHSRLRSGHLE